MKTYRKLSIWHVTEALIVGQGFSNWLKDTAAGFILTVTEVQPAGFWLEVLLVASRLFSTTSMAL